MVNNHFILVAAAAFGDWDVPVTILILGSQATLMGKSYKTNKYIGCILLKRKLSSLRTSFMYLKIKLWARDNNFSISIIERKAEVEQCSFSGIKPSLACHP